MSVDLDYAPIFECLDYYFRDPELLDRALRHRSVGDHCNERLEFLGDAVLNFIVAEELCRRYPDMKEGELSRFRSNLVNGEVLADLANDLKIGPFIRFGHGELRSEGRWNRSILADAVEAIIGAIYLDSGFVVTQRHVLGWLTPRIANLSQVSEKDPKTKLQELLHAKRLPLPLYSVVEVGGVAHARHFRIACQVEGVKVMAEGEGTNKRAAEREAAAKMLLYLGVGGDNG